MTAPPPGRTRGTLTEIIGFAEELRLYVTTAGAQNLYDDRRTQLIAEALLHRIGEAVSRLPDDLTSAHPEVEWRKIKGMRNVVAHQYGFIDYRIVWRALDQSLPNDVESIKQILADLKE